MIKAKYKVVEPYYMDESTPDVVTIYLHLRPMNNYNDSLSSSYYINL